MEFIIEDKLALKNKLISLLEKVNEKYIKAICEKYIDQLNNGYKSFTIVENITQELKPFQWDAKVNEFTRELDQILNENACTYGLANYITTFGLHTTEYDKAFKERLTKVAKQLGEDELKKELKYGDLNFYGKIYPNFGSVVEMAYMRDNENPALNNNNVVSPIVPIMELKDGVVFYLHGDNFYYEPQNNLLEKHNGFPDDTNYMKMVEAINTFKISKKEAVCYTNYGKIKVNYLSGEPIVSVNDTKIDLNNNSNVVSEMIYLGNLQSNEQHIVGITLFLAENFHRLVELDFAQTIYDSVNESKFSTFFKLGNNTHVINYDVNNKRNDFKSFNDINECVKYVNNWVGFNIYESLDNMFGNEKEDLTKYKTLKREILNSISSLKANKTKLENTGLVTENEKIKEAYDLVDNKLNKLYSKLQQVNEHLGVKENFEESLFVEATVLGKYRNVPVGAIVKVEESVFQTSLSENPVQVWLNGEKIFIPKKFLML